MRPSMIRRGLTVLSVAALLVTGANTIGASPASAGVKWGSSAPVAASVQQSGVKWGSSAPVAASVQQSGVKWTGAQSGVKWTGFESAATRASVKLAAVSQTCNIWRDSTWGQARWCVDNVSPFYSHVEYTSLNGTCVHPLQWNGSGWVSRGWPNDCSNTGITVKRAVYNGGVRLYNDAGNYFTVCDSGNPNTDAPTCIPNA